MSTAENELELAKEVAIELAKKFDFDCREVISSEPVSQHEGHTVFRIVLRLWTSPARIDETISKYGEGQDLELMQRVLTDGNKISIEATSHQVISHKWLGIQFS